MVKSLRKSYSWIVLFMIVALSGLLHRPSGCAMIVSSLLQTTGPQPPLPSVQPPPTHPVDDIPFRHAQLENLSKDVERAQRESLRARELMLRSLQERNERLNLDAQKILQLSMSLNKSFEQDDGGNSAERIQIATKLEKLAHEVRTTLASRGMSHPDPTKKKVSVTPASGDELLRQSRQCVQLALQLKQHMDRMLDPQNQNTVSADALKASKTKDKQQGISPIMSTAESIENLSYGLSHSLQEAPPAKTIADN